MPWVAVNLCPGELIRVTDLVYSRLGAPLLDLCVLPLPNDLDRNSGTKLLHECDCGIITEIEK